VLRVRECGEILEHINVTGGSTYACMLGGEERRDLYICVAPHHDRNVTRRERGGRIDVVRVSVPGAGLP
jgi:sugar lactone lactonase YvrE